MLEITNFIVRVCFSFLLIQYWRSVRFELTNLGIIFRNAVILKKKEAELVFIEIKIVNLHCKIKYNDMEIQGKIIAALEPRGGVSQRTGNAWKVQEFVLETHEQFPRKCVFEVFGEDKLQSMNIQVGEELTVSFDIDAREWTGQDGRSRWTNQIRAWRVLRQGEVAAAAAAQPGFGAAPAGFAAPQSAAPAPAQPAAPAGDPFGAPAPGVGAEGGDLPF